MSSVNSSRQARFTCSCRSSNKDICCRIHRKINLIPFNPFPNSGYERPSGNAVSRFWQVLVDAGYVVTVRTTRGDDIDAACGQLVGDVVDRTRRSARYEQRRRSEGEAHA